MQIIDDREKIKEYIKKYDINEIFTQDLTSYMKLFKWDKNEFICKEGDEVNNFYFLVEGKAKVFRNLANGKSLLISFYNPLRIIGDMEIIKQSSADCSVQSISDTYCIGMHFNDVRSILLEDNKFLRHICNYLTDKLSSGSTNSSINIYYSLESRIASYFCALLKENINVKYQNNDYVIHLEENYSELADMLGTSYRHLNRTINKMCSDNLLEKHDKYYVIKNLEKLKAMSGDIFR